MLIAREKKKNNIAEYILYMWQLEDMLRALKLDMEQVDRYLVAGFQADERTSKEIHDWYDNLIAIMQKEKVEESFNCILGDGCSYIIFVRLQWEERGKRRCGNDYCVFVDHKAV